MKLMLSHIKSIRAVYDGGVIFAVKTLADFLQPAFMS